MAAIVYPAALPGPQSAPLTPAERRALSDGAGPLQVRSRQRDFRGQQQLEFVMTAQQVASFHAWWADDLTYGGARFAASDWPTLQGYTGGVYRFMEPPRWEHLARGIQRLRIAVEVWGRAELPQLAEIELLWDASSSSPLWVISDGGRTAHIGPFPANAHPYPARNLFANRNASGGKRYFEFLISDDPSSAVEPGYAGVHTVALRSATANRSSGTVVSKTGLMVVNDPTPQAGPYDAAPYTNCGLSCRPSWRSTPLTLMFAIDLDGGSMWFGKNGSWFGADPAAGTLPILSNVVGPLKPYCASFANQPDFRVTLRSKAEHFAYAVPSGFDSLASGG